MRVPYQQDQSAFRKGELNSRQLERDQCAQVPESQRGCGYHSASKPQRETLLHLLREGIRAKSLGPQEHLCFHRREQNGIGGFRMSWKQNAISKAHLSGGAFVSKSGSHLGHWFSQLAQIWPQRTNPLHSAKLTQGCGCSAKCSQCPWLAWIPPGWPEI